MKTVIGFLKQGRGISVWGLGLLLLASACNIAREQQEDTVEQIDEVTEIKPVPQMTAEQHNASILGSYVGDFRAESYADGATSPSYVNRINLSIDSMRGDSVFGHSIVAGNDARFTGIYRSNASTYQVEAKELGDNLYGGKFRFKGDDLYNGKFSFTIDSFARTIEGEWEAFDTTLDVPKRSFKLKKRLFAYNPNHELPEYFAYTALRANQDESGGEYEGLTEDVLKFNASKTLLKKDNIENMKRGDLEVMRNAIYARHGYSFRNRNMRYLFDNVDWYIPVSTDIRGNLTEIEQKNIALLKRYEQHAEKYYDYFGR